MALWYCICSPSCSWLGFWSPFLFKVRQKWGFAPLVWLTVCESWIWAMFRGLGEMMKMGHSRASREVPTLEHKRVRVEQRQRPDPFLVVQPSLCVFFFSVNKNVIREHFCHKHPEQVMIHSKLFKIIVSGFFVQVLRTPPPQGMRKSTSNLCNWGLELVSEQKSDVKELRRSPCEGTMLEILTLSRPVSTPMGI